MFRYELCNVGNIRKMRVILPQITTNKIEHENDSETGELINESKGLNTDGVTSVFPQKS